MLIHFFCYRYLNYVPYTQIIVAVNYDMTYIQRQTFKSSVPKLPNFHTIIDQMKLDDWINYCNFFSVTHLLSAIYITYQKPKTTTKIGCVIMKN